MGKANAKGRSKGEAKHVRDYEWMLRSPAYRSLSCYARCLLHELKRLYMGENNGELFMSVRFAANVLGAHKDTAAKAFHELQDHGFIRPRIKSGFSWKPGQATTWILTEYEFAGQLATKDFMRWRPESENAKHGPTRPHTVLPDRTLWRPTVLPNRTLLPEMALKVSYQTAHI